MNVLRLSGALVCLLLLLECVSARSDYRAGDLVRLSKRSQFGKTMTPWTDLTMSMCPRYRQDKSIELSAITDDVLLNGPGNRETAEIFRFMLGIEGENFISPWFSVRDAAREQSLVLLNVIFIFNGPTIIDVRWKADYDDHGDHGQREVKPLLVNYTWEQFDEEDPYVGVASILIWTFFATLGLLTYILISETENISHASSDLPLVMNAPFQDAPRGSSADYSFQSPLYNPPPLHEGGMSVPAPSFKSD